MQTVNIYTYSTIKRPGKRDGVGIYILQLDGCGDQGTRKQIITLLGRTQQGAELELIRSAIHRIHTAVHLRIFTESASVAAAFKNGWIRKWEMDGWKNNKGGDVANAEAWQDILRGLNGIGMQDDAIEWHVQERNEFRELMRWEATNKLAEWMKKS